MITIMDIYYPYTLIEEPYAERLEIDMETACKLVERQFPKWKNLPIQPVKVNGWCTKNFRLGEDMLIKFPTAKRYSRSIENIQASHLNLEKIAMQLPLPVPRPIAIGHSEKIYPWNWSVLQWVEGNNFDFKQISNKKRFAWDLTEFLNALYSLETTNGPLPGPHNFFRGNHPEIYEIDTLQAILKLKEIIDEDKVLEIWNSSKGSKWEKEPVWFHGDLSQDNLLVKDGKLYGVIDLGLTIGDPACDLVVAWTIFSGESRSIFKKRLNFDKPTWARARCWTLWKALISLKEIANSGSPAEKRIKKIIRDVIEDHEKFL